MLKDCLSERFVLLEQLADSSAKYISQKKRIEDLMQKRGLSAFEEKNFKQILARLNKYLDWVHFETADIQLEVRKITSKGSMTLISSNKRPA